MEPQAEGGQLEDTRAGQGGVRKPGEGDFSGKGSPWDPPKEGLVVALTLPDSRVSYPRLKLNPITRSQQLCGP